MSTSADFYIGTGPSAEWIGHISQDGSAAEMDELNLFGGDDNGDTRYVEATFREVVSDLVDSNWADGKGYGPRIDGPHRPDDLPTPAMVYAFVTGSVHVFEYGTDMSGTEGMLLVAVHHPNGARKVTEFAGLVVS